MQAPSPFSITQQLVRLSFHFPIAPPRLNSAFFFIALGHALATQSRPLVYGGGTRGIMGIISDSVLRHGGSVVAVVPSAMLRAGGEGEQHSTWGPIGHDKLEEKGRDMVSTVCDRRCRDRRLMFYVFLIDQRSNL